jgi:hypothetical protein
LLPVECWRGVSLIQAAKSRPRSKVSTGGANAFTAVAMPGPMPGIVISRLGVSSWRARLATSWFVALILVERLVITSIRP